MCNSSRIGDLAALMLIGSVSVRLFEQHEATNLIIVNLMVTNARCEGVANAEAVTKLNEKNE